MGLGRVIVDITATMRLTILGGEGHSGGVTGGVGKGEVAALVTGGVGVVCVSDELTLGRSGVKGLATNAQPMRPAAYSAMYGRYPGRTSLNSLRTISLLLVLRA